jgi:hypothetical protein
MDVIIIIIVLFLLVPTLIIGLLVLLEARRKQIIRTRLQSAVDQLVKNNQLRIVDIEFFRDRVIGIDKVKKKLVFVQFRKEGLKTLSLDLKAISFCRVTKTIDRFSGEVIEIFLHFKYEDSDQLFTVNFYDRSYDDPRAKQSSLEKARVWKDKINLHRSTTNSNRQYEYML